MTIKLTEQNSRDIWSTSVFSYTGAGGGPGGGKEDDHLRVGGWGDTYVILFQFDLPDVSCDSKAVLRLFNTRDGAATTPLYLNVVTAPWNWLRGDRLWWRNLPTYSSWQSKVLEAPAIDAWYDIDISDLFAKWCSKEMPNYGVLLSPVQSNNNYDNFYSTRYAGNDDLAPRLVVTPR